jgi:hypothetical protein
MRLLTLPVLLITALACTGDEGIDEDDGGDESGEESGDEGGDEGGDDTCESDADCPSWSICEDSECVDGDRNNSVDEAESLLWDDSIDGYINPADDVDYFSFEADGGEFVYINVLDDEDEETDVVIVLRKPNGKVLAMADAYATGTSVTGVDAAIFAYIPEAGSYSISVEDAGSYYSGGDAYGAQDYSFELSLSEWSQATAETDGFEQPNVTLGVDTERLWTSVGFVLEEDGDSDFVTVEYNVEDAVIYMDGNQYVDGTDLSIQMRLLHEDGTVLSDKEDVGPEGYAIYPSASTGTYIIELSDALGTGGAEHWGFLHFISRLDGYVHDNEDEPNDYPLDAQELTLEEYENSAGNLFRRGQADGAIDVIGDADLYSFSVDYKENYLCTCVNSVEYGSATAPTFEILDSDGALVQYEDSDGELQDAIYTGDGAQDPDTLIENLPLESGDYMLRVSGAKKDGGPGNWYRFNFFASSFEVASYADGGFACP